MREVVTATSLDAPGSHLKSSLSDAPGDRRFLRALSIDCYGRSALPAERKALAGKSRAEVIRGAVASLPFWHGYYEEELFYFLLIDNFRPSTDLFTSLPHRLHQSQLSVKDMLRQLVSSQFFNARNPGNDTFVTVVLEQLLGMTVQERRNVRTLEAGKKMYDGYKSSFLKKKGANQADLVRIVVENKGFEPFFIGRRFEAIFRQPMPAKRLEKDAARLRQSPRSYSGIIGDWLSSRAYEKLLESTPRPKSDRTFIRSLFVDLLGREPEYQELRRCRNALLALSDSGPLRSVVTKLMLDSDMTQVDEKAARKDPDGFVRGLFLRFLCRNASDQEVKTFASVMRSSGCSARTVVRALLTHSEYQHY